jgi:membrane protein YdbS with pleckstrin-like domain
MYELLKRLSFPLLKVEESRPEPPAGHEKDESLRIFRACPAYLQYKLFYWKLYAAVWALAVLAVSAVILAIDVRFIFLVIPLLLFAAYKAAVLYTVARLDYEMRWYVVTDRSLLIRQGVWIVREITLTFANAQNVHVKQGPIERLFGFSNVEVDTAGGGGGGKNEQGVQSHRAVLRGLDNPQEVRSLILELLRHHRTAGLGDPDDHPHQAQPPAPSSFNPALLGEILSEAKRLRRSIESGGG